MRSIHYTSTERTIKNVIDSLIGYNGYNRQNGCYLSLRLDIDPAEFNVDQRGFAFGVHFLKYGMRILGAIDDDFLFPTWSKRGGKREWESISTHDSCWADSTMHWVANFISSLSKQKKNHPKLVRYLDDDITWGKMSSSLGLENVSLIPVEELFGVQYKDYHVSDDPEPADLIPEFMREELSIAN